jgi:hypothetical protein
MTFAPAARQRADRIFFSGITAVSIAVVFAGFAKSYYLRALGGARPLSALVQLHAAVFSAWMVMFAIQAWLVAAGRTTVHRRVGVAGVVVGVAVLIVGCATAIDGARTGWFGSQTTRDVTRAVPFLALPLGDLLLFGGFFTAAVYRRRQPDAHKRLMVLATIGGIVPAALGRLPGTAALVAALALLSAGPVYDRMSRGRVHPVYKWGILLIVLSYPLRFWIGGTGAWRSIVGWLTG